ncbi:MAG: phosphopantetheine-binding protein [Ferruginibacter sp.]
MDIKSFETNIAELLEVDSVNDTDVLENFEAWDSLTSLSIIAFVGENYNISLSSNDLIQAGSIRGLKDLVLSKLTNG